MKRRKPSPEAMAAWIRLVRVQSRVLGVVEQDMKKAGFPPLSWYDALLELSRAPCGALRPVELEKQMLLPQYGLSRLIERLVGNQALITGQNQRLAQRRAIRDAQRAGLDPRLGNPGNLDLDGIAGRLGHGVQLPG